MSLCYDVSSDHFNVHVTVHVSFSAKFSVSADARETVYVRADVNIQCHNFTLDIDAEAISNTVPNFHVNVKLHV